MLQFLLQDFLRRGCESFVTTRTVPPVKPAAETCYITVTPETYCIGNTRNRNTTSDNFFWENLICQSFIAPPFPSLLFCLFHPPILSPLMLPPSVLHILLLPILPSPTPLFPYILCILHILSFPLPPLTNTHSPANLVLRLSHLGAFKESKI